MKQKKIQQKLEKENKTKVSTRQIIIETDGSNIRIVKAETAGKIELIAILQAIIGELSNPKNK